MAIECYHDKECPLHIVHHGGEEPLCSLGEGEECIFDDPEGLRKYIWQLQRRIKELMGLKP